MISVSWQYVAGFFDGEGHLRCDDRATGYINPQITLTQAAPQQKVLFEIQKFLATAGIKCSIHKRGSKSKKWSDCYVLVITGQEDALNFIDSVLPFLIVKKTQAKAVKVKVHTRLEARSRPHWRSRFSDEEVSEMRELWLGGTTQAEIGRMYGTSQRHVGRLVRRMEIAV